MLVSQGSAIGKTVYHQKLLPYVQDPVHRLAWSLDACLKDRVLDEKRMRELHQFFVPLNKPAAVGTGSREP